MWQEFLDLCAKADKLFPDQCGNCVLFRGSADTFPFKQQIQLVEINSVYETVLVFWLFMNWTLVLNCLQRKKKSISV